MTALVQDAIVLLGDSITQRGWEPGGFAQRLAHAYARKFDVINRGLSGYNTEWAIPVFEQCLARQNEQAFAPKMRLLTIWFGANDSVLPAFFQHVPLVRFAENLTHLIRMVRAPDSVWHSPGTQVVLITPPPVNTHQRRAELAARDPPEALDRAFNTTAEYAQAVRRVGVQEGMPVVDAWQALWHAAGRDEEALSKYLRDGLHLTAEGYFVVYEELIKTIREQMPELHYANLQDVFIRYDQVDLSNPRASLTKRNIDG